MRTVHVIHQPGPLGTQGTAIDWVIGITFDVEDVLLGILAITALAVHQQATTY